MLITYNPVGKSSLIQYITYSLTRFRKSVETNKQTKTSFNDSLNIENILISEFLLVKMFLGSGIAWKFSFYI